MQAMQLPRHYVTRSDLCRLCYDVSLARLSLSHAMQSMLSDSFVVLQLMVAQFLLRVSYPHCFVTARDPYRRVRVYD